jgi:N-acetylneuraminic acid mutarotase
MVLFAASATGQERALTWRQLPALPDREGFAAMFAGVSGGALLAAGGANFPERRPWEGGTKRWYDAVYLLEPDAAKWRIVGALPRAGAYGVSVTTEAGIVCAGGGDAVRHFRDVYLLQWKDGNLTTTTLPELPRPCAFTSGALVGKTLYLVGGIETPDATACLDTLWSLDTADPKARWRELPACPGGARMLAVVGAAESALFAFGGTRLSRGPDGKAVRTYLRDAWRYTPGDGWKRLTDLPRPAVAAPSPAPAAGASLLVIGGDDGTKVNFRPETEHPGFPRDVLAYDVQRDTWTKVGTAPFSRATVPTTQWQGEYIVPSGEVRPGYRSPEAWGLRVR